MLPELSVPWQVEPFADARLLVLNDALSTELSLDPAFLRGPDGLEFLTGAAVPDDATPVAQAYAGHQFGGFSPRLGDGRALLIGEVVDIHGQVRDIHLKGSGPTPLSRGGDGFAAVGPMLREYVISEAMHALGIPTTRSLAVVATGRPVRRETELPGALLTRSASSHLRVGSFEFAAAAGDRELLHRLVDFALRRHYPELAGADNAGLALFGAVVSAQASLVAQWMLVGFVHGVMNTDNMTVSGETIDYGPCAFIDAFDPNTVYSSIDIDGRYAFGNQPTIAEWNLARFAEALLPTFDDDPARAVELAQELLGTFRAQYAAAWSTGMRAKLGLAAGVDESLSDSLVHDLIDHLTATRADYTSFFRRLSGVARGDSGAREALVGAAPERDEALEKWMLRWLSSAPDADAMDAVNPVYIPRNHLVEAALAAAIDGDPGLFAELVGVVTDPYTARPGFERYTEPAPDSFGDYRTFCGT